MAKKITVIGGSGFVGTNLCRQLALKQQDFEIIDLKMSNQFPDKCKIADVRDAETLRKTITGGQPQYLPCDESHPLEPINPYGRTKLMGENLLQDWSTAMHGRHAVALRYFNPVGADASGLIGEDPNGIPNNLMPFISQVAVGRRDCLQVFGDDYETIDGTGVRDYIHVVDLAQAHVAAVEQMNNLEPFEAVNIGTGDGLSVLQMVKEFEIQSGETVKYRIGPRRPGDAPAVWADATKAINKIGFKANRGIIEMCQDTWRWQHTNPAGYTEK